MVSLCRNDGENVMKSEGEDYVMETHRGELILCAALGRAPHTLDLNSSICKRSEFVQMNGS